MKQPFASVTICSSADRSRPALFLLIFYQTGCFSDENRPCVKATSRFRFRSFAADSHVTACLTGHADIPPNLIKLACNQ